MTNRKCRGRTSAKQKKEKSAGSSVGSKGVNLVDDGSIRIRSQNTEQVMGWAAAVAASNSVEQACVAPRPAGCLKSGEAHNVLNQA